MCNKSLPFTELRYEFTTVLLISKKNNEKSKKTRQAYKTGGAKLQI